MNEIKLMTSLHATDNSLSGDRVNLKSMNLAYGKSYSIFYYQIFNILLWNYGFVN